MKYLISLIVLDNIPIYMIRQFLFVLATTILVSGWEIQRKQVMG